MRTLLISSFLFVFCTALHSEANQTTIAPQLISQGTVMNSELNPISDKAKTLIGTVQQHYKGNQYEVIAVARHSETLEELIVYRSLKDAAQVWVRPVDMFLESLEFEGKLVPRFFTVK